MDKSIRDLKDEALGALLRQQYSLATDVPRSIKTASFTGRFRTVNDEKTASLRP